MRAGRTMAPGQTLVAVAGGIGGRATKKTKKKIKKSEDARRLRNFLWSRRCSPLFHRRRCNQVWPCGPRFLVAAADAYTRRGPGDPHWNPMPVCLFWPGLIVVGPLSSAHNVRQPASGRHLGQTPPLVENIDKRLEALGAQGSEVAQTVSGLGLFIVV